jgi:hypothetical protein
MAGCYYLLERLPQSDSTPVAGAPGWLGGCLRGARLYRAVDAARGRMVTVLRTARLDEVDGGPLRERLADAFPTCPDRHLWHYVAGLDAGIARGRLFLAWATPADAETLPEVPPRVEALLRYLLDEREMLETNAAARAAPEARTPPPAPIHATDREDGFWQSRLMERLGKVCCVIGLGILAACAVVCLTGRHADPFAGVRKAPTPPSACVTSSGRSYPSLAAAVTVAADGEVLTVVGAGPHRLHPLVLRGKSLTLRAAPGPRPQLVLQRRAGDGQWHGLISSDSTLSLAGLDLSAEEGPLVNCEGGNLELRDCRLKVSHAGPAVVACQSPRIELADCKIEAPLGVGVEVGSISACRVRLGRCTLPAGGRAGCAIALWGRESSGVTALDLHLEESEIHADRCLTCRGLKGPTRVHAHRVAFHFHDALLHGCALADAASWRNAIQWRGSANRYHPREAWLAIDGQSLPVRDLAAWQEWWRMVEPGSCQEPARTAATTHTTARVPH